MPRKPPARPASASQAFVRSIQLRRDEIEQPDRYPYVLPAIAALRELPLHPRVTFLAGENGSGKSTLVEAIAIALGFNAEGGSQNFRFSTRKTESPLHQHLRVVRGARRPRDGFFLRAESFYNVASAIEDYGATAAYGGRSLHEMSHGEAFMALASHRFGERGVFVLDEPEAALSPQRQLAFLGIMDEVVQRREGQMIVATHSPFLLAYPDARIHWLSERGIAEVKYEEIEHYWLTRDFLSNRERYFKRLLGPRPDEPGA